MPTRHTWQRNGSMRSARPNIPGSTRSGHVYLDYTAGSLYAASQIERHSRCCARACSATRTRATRLASRSTELCTGRGGPCSTSSTRSPDEWIVDLHGERQPGAEARRRGVPVRPGGRYLLTFDNHNSVNGIREFARAQGAATTYVPIVLPEMRLDEARLIAQLDAAPGRAAPLRVSGAVELLRRAAPARVGRARAARRAGTCCSTRRRSRRPTGWTSGA